jgi:DNA mismatch repair protein MutS
MAKYTPMIEQYLSIKADYPDAFLFFRLGDFYELFFDDAVRASRELEITLTGRGGGSEERIPMCGVPHHSVESYFQQLLKKGYKVAICEQVEDPKDAKGVVRREVVRILTPGTVMEGKLLSERENNYLVAAWASSEGFAVAACDISTGHFHAAALDSLEQLMTEVSSYQPKEVIMNDSEYREEISHRCHWIGAAPIQTIPEYPQDEVEQAAGKYCTSYPDNKALRLVIGSLLLYLQSTQKRMLQHIQGVEVYRADNYMIIDSLSKRNLELTETLIDKTKKGSLLWYLDQTVTPMGARLLRKWIDKPLLHPEQINSRLNGVRFFVEHLLVRQELRQLLKSVYDLERLAGRIAFGNANAKDLINLNRSLQTVPYIQRLIMVKDKELPELVHSLIGQMDPCLDLSGLISESIADDPPLSLKEGGLIKYGFNDYLDKLKSASTEGKKWIASLEQQEREATGIKSLKVGFNKVFGYYIEITKSNFGSIPANRYERKQTLANAERFITPELKEQEALILEAEEKLVELEYQLFTDIRSQIAEQIERLQKLAKQVAALDVLAAWGEVAQENRLVRPMIEDDASIVIKEGRHPVVERALESSPFIANDTFLNDRENRMLLITGPNMAGKSTYMRQMALISIMAQIGCYVPAAEASLSIVDRIFTRIGAADDLVGGQSTFMVEMNDIQLMTTKATKKSLVIIDEIGRGTSTHDGMSIAQAVIEYIHQTIQCKALVSTHYHELAVLESSLQGLKNYHMAVQEEQDNVIFLRKLKPGSTSESYGIYCAKLAGLPTEIITRAEELLGQYKKGLSEEIDSKRASNSQTSDNAVDSIEELQLNFFPASIDREENATQKDKKASKLIKELREIDLINMTPLEAINYLYEIKQRVSSKD